LYFQLVLFNETACVGHELRNGNRRPYAENHEQRRPVCPGSSTETSPVACLSRVPVRVLIVEDDDDLRAEIAEYLRRRHYEVDACGSVAAARLALEGLLAGPATAMAVVCDANLPDGSGVDFYRDFADRTPTTRWLLMSGNHDPKDLENTLDGCSRATAPTIVDKPVRLAQLRQLLDGATGP
jgi:DNA-binding NtrC family response regulator